MSTPDALVTISGTADVREKIARPDGGVLSIKLVTNDGEVLAATAVPDTGGSLPFELVADAALAPEPSTLRLWAMLRTEVGVWGTPELVSVREDLVLSRVDG